MEASNLPQWAAVLLGFLSVVPIFLALSRTTVREYSAFGSMCDRWLSSRPPGPAVLSGILAGGLAAGLLLLLFSLGLGGSSAGENQVGVMREPAKPLNWTLQIAFFYAGFLEEAAKLGLALLFMFAFSLRRAEGKGLRFVVLRSAPFLAAAAGLGFSLVENVRFLQNGGTSAIGALVIGRALFASTAHTVIDFHFGLSLFAGRELRAGVLLRAFLVAVLFHGVYDFFALPEGTFAHLLASFFLVLIAAWAVVRMHEILPETRHRPGRVREEAPVEYMRREAALPGAVYFVRELLHDPHRLVRPAPGHPPFAPEEFPFQSDLVRRAVLSPEYRGPVPLADQARWIRIERAVSLAVTGRPAEGRAWDTSVFADLLEEDPRADHALRTLGIDLVELQPLRIIEHEPEPARPWYLYTTCGLAGPDFWISFPHPFPLVRLLFVHMASAREGSELSLANRLSWDPFEIVKIDPLVLGDPRGWFRGLMPVPVLDPAGRRYFEETEGEGNLPVELLYLSAPDIHWIERHGVRSWFENLKSRGISWFPDFRRPPPG